MKKMQTERHNLLLVCGWGVVCSSALFIFCSVGLLLGYEEIPKASGVVRGEATAYEIPHPNRVIHFSSLKKSQSYQDFDVERVSANSFIVLDAKTTDILLAKKANEAHPIASLSKLVTAWFLMERGFESSNAVLVPEKNNRNVFQDYGIDSIQTGDAVSAIDVAQGEVMSASDLLAASLIGSANNATFALVQSQGYSPESFRSSIDQLLDHYHLYQTAIVEPTGLDKRNTSTAEELAYIASRAFSYQELRNITSKASAQLQGQKASYRIQSTNELLGEPITLLAGKTGFLEEARYTYMVIVRHITGRELIIVLLGSESSEQRFDEAEHIIGWVNRSYE